MGLTQIEELNSEPMRALASKIIRDALNEAKQTCAEEEEAQAIGKRRKEALLFLSGGNGMCQAWLSCLPALDADVMMAGIKKLVGNGFVKAKPPKPKRKQQPTIGIKHGKKTLTVQQAADILGYSYSTVYRRHALFPTYNLSKLRLVMPAKKDGRSIRKRHGRSAGAHRNP